MKLLVKDNGIRLAFKKGTGLATSFNASNYLTVPTYEGSGEAIHPDVLYFPDKTNISKGHDGSKIY